MVCPNVAVEPISLHIIVQVMLLASGRLSLNIPLNGLQEKASWEMPLNQ